MSFFLRLIALAGLLLPASAMAHNFFPESGSFVNGLVHPYVIPAHIIAIALSGILIGQQGSQTFLPAFVSFFLALLTGLIITLFWLWPSIQEMILITCTVFGVVIAIGKRLPSKIYYLLLVVAGLMIGLDSPQESFLIQDRIMAFIGTITGVYFGLIWAAGLTDTLNKSWMKIGIRILGSWGAASAILVLALILFSPPNM